MPRRLRGLLHRPISSLLTLAPRYDHDAQGARAGLQRGGGNVLQSESTTPTLDQRRDCCADRPALSSRWCI
jgi:hypothetical protein